MNRYLFAGILGVLFSMAVLAVLDQPYALVVSSIGSLVIGWFSADVYRLMFGGSYD